MLRGWAPELRTSSDGKPKNQWKIVDLDFKRDADGPHKLMSLNTDLCLGYTNNEAQNCL